MSAPLHVLNSAELQVTITAQGAELQSIRSRADGAEWLWQGDAAWWAGRAPLLFPVVGRSPQDRVTIAGQDYPMGSHGFARHSSFTPLAVSDSEARFELRPDAAIRAVYPFEFRLTMTYRLQGDRLACLAQVANDGELPMPCQFGFHPALVWPLPGAQGQQHLVVLENGAAPAMLRPDADGLMGPVRHPSPFRGGQLVVDAALFEAGAMVFPQGAGTEVRLTAPAAEVRMVTGNLPAFALWQKPGAPFLCLEPWHGMAPFPSQGPDLARRSQAMLLAAGAVAEFAMELQFRRNPA